MLRGAPVSFQIYRLMKKTILDGCTAAAHVAYALSEVATIYPITPIASMGETADAWAASGRLNVFGSKMEVKEMESELGAAGATHGALCGGALATTFTSSQGLMLMIPNMYKIAGERLPGVFHVGCRSLATHALSIFGDHQDAMACRATGFAMLASDSVQATMDLALVAHLAAIESSVPFLHMFDGFRTSNEMQSIEAIEYVDMLPLVDMGKVEAFRRRAMNPEHPDTRGTAQNPDVYFQNSERSNADYDSLPAVVEQCMEKVGKLTGREYHIFDYIGSPEAEYVTVSIGSSCDVAEVAVKWLVDHGYKVGHVKVRLYRPWNSDAFMKCLPTTVKVVAALDRTKEPGSMGEPLFLDVCSSVQESGRAIKVIGGRYGLASKDFTPAMMRAIFDEMAKEEPRRRFTVGINDDLTHLSLEVGPKLDPLAGAAYQSVFYGIGADGTVGATKQAASIISNHSDYYSQAYFSYSAKKSGGYTISELRFSKEPVKAEYRIESADYVGCNKSMYVDRYDMLSRAKDGAIFVLNSPWKAEEMERRLPASMRREIARKKLKFYNIDATAVASRNGLGSRVNMVTEAVFFRLTDIIPYEEAVEALKESVKIAYGHEGADVVSANCRAIDEAITSLEEINYPDSWATSEDAPVEERKNEPEWVVRVARPMLRLEGDRLPVSAMPVGGVVPCGTTAYEKRRIAIDVPEWDPAKCVQCAICSTVCAHAAIRPFVAEPKEIADSPEGFATVDAKASALKGMKWRIQTYVEDCTGCGSCVTMCPGHALSMTPLSSQLPLQPELLLYAQTHVGDKSGAIPRGSVVGSQLYQPLLEFSGACGGCGETPYVKMLTQLMGERIVIANATGCSSIWGANMPSQAYCANSKGCGPAWGNSLFEDNAEYGYGIATALLHRRESLAAEVSRLVADPAADPSLVALLKEWQSEKEDYGKSAASADKIKEWLAAHPGLSWAEAVEKDADLLARKSVWAIGGDGWAFDIGFAGLDHVLASGLNINMLVMDTQCYSNTGGQTSKATPLSACAKYSYDGKRVFKKNLGEMMITYGNVYVASVALGGNMMQTIKALQEAEAYEGPSIVIAYCPCIEHGIKAGMSKSIVAEREAVATGFWPLYRYDPTKETPLTIDTPATALKEMLPFLEGENRFAMLSSRVGTTTASSLFATLASHDSRLLDQLRAGKL